MLGTVVKVFCNCIFIQFKSSIRYTVGNFGYIMFVVQHPYGADTLHTDTAAAWQPLLDQNPVGKTSL
jgi:hypothetical protein